MAPAKRTKPQLVTLLSENDLCQSWLAACPVTGENRFVKTPNPDSPIDKQTAVSILSKSYACQRRIVSGRVVTSAGKYTDQGKLHIEYPYLDPDRFKPLTPEAFWKHPDNILIQMCQLVDLLHLWELVHCDLKLNNFLVKDSIGNPQLLLVDLDFLTESGSSPKANVFGTPEHIAPEILANDRVLPQSDNFSIGVALRQCLDCRDSHGDASAGRTSVDTDHLSALVESLTADHPMHRPYSLLDGLHKHKIIGADHLESAHKTVLAMQLMPALTRLRSVAVADSDTLRTQIIENNRILGIHTELREGLADVYSKNKSLAVRLFKSLIRDSKVVRLGDYWQVSVTDNKLSDVFDRIDSILHGARSGQLGAGVSVSNAESLLETVAKYRQAGLLYRAFLVLKNALDDSNSEHLADLNSRAALLKEASVLADGLGRLTDSATFLKALVDVNRECGCIDSDSFHDLVDVLIDIGETDTCDDLIEEGISRAMAESDLRNELKLLRLKAWLAGVRGEYEKSDEILERVTAIANRSGFYDLAFRARHNMGINCWRQGLFAEAEVRILEALKIAEKRGMLPEAVTVISGLVLLYRNMADYGKAIQYAKVAMKHLTPSANPRVFSFMTVLLSLSLSRLGNHDKAVYWLMRSLESGVHGDFQIWLASYYNADTQIRFNKGDYDAAELAAHRALDLSDGLERRQIEEKNYHMAAEVARCRGQYAVCREYLRSARDLLRDYPDESALAELDFISTLNDIYNDLDESGCGRLPGIVNRMINNHGYYYAALGLFQMLVSGEADVVNKALEMARSLTSLLQDSKVPLFRAITALVDLEASEPGNRHEEMRTLKSVYRILDDLGEKFLALIVCERIASIYRAHANDKLAGKFYQQALKIASYMRNQPWVDRLAEKIEEISEVSTSSTGMIQSIHGISEVFKNIENYAQSLDEVIKFAVGQTGAERGVLLMKSEHSSSLKIAAAVNCDDDSLSDIKDFSSSIPTDVAQSFDPLIVDNAMADKRTKNYKSIVVHNILSVICIPISIEDRILGVLYLDHHTIPALFDKDDITYVSSIANLMAVMITTIQSYRDITVINRQLVEDVGRASDQPFVTHDASMMELLGRLPEIARTNATVLITGESGTGKEILCEMIHKLSLRSDKPLVKLNCAAIAGSLIESELFGVAPNVATDVKEREGKFSAADGGTLLLDEIGEMPLEIQAKVLRAVENQQFEKVGSNKTIYTDTRFIYATNKNLAEMVTRGEFRSDLFYRINTISIEIPPLRERQGDVLLLTEHFTRLFSRQDRAPRFTTEALEVLSSYPWPGNVRELRNFVERYCILYAGRKVDVSVLPPEIQKTMPDITSAESAAATVEKDRINRALVKSDWNQSRASKELEIPLSTLRRKIKKYGITRSV